MVILILTLSGNVNTEDIVVLSVGGVVTIAWFVIGHVCVSSIMVCSQPLL